MTRCTFYLCLSLALLLSAGAAQDSFSFPSPAANSDSFSNYASHDNPTWRDFRDFIKHPVYGSIGTPVGRLNLTYEGQDSFELYDGGNCTATIISERLVISNAHCVYSPRYSPSAGEIIRLTNLSLAMDVHAASETGDVYPVKIKPIELNETLDFAILEFAAASPYDTYGAVDLSNHRSANVGESLFMIHHSNITGRFDGTNYKRITESNCTRLNASQFENNNIPILMPDEEKRRSVNPTQDIPHFCDSEQGSSGSLIYARDDSAVVGLHFSGRNARDEADRFNLYVDIEAICSQSRVLPRFCTPQQGSLTVTSNPSGATVSIDGQVIGTTPLNEPTYDAGVYRLSLDYNGYETHSESIRISTGQTLQRDIALQTEAPQQGSLTVTSNPSGATVSIDGQVIGTTPLQNQAYDVGIYELSLDADGYQLYSESIRIATGQVLQRDIALEAREPEVIRTAEQLVRRAKDGGTLKLAAVTFRLDAPLELSGDVVLLGEGYEETRIVSSAPEYVVHYTGGDTFVAQGIGFEHVGEESAYVVKVENGVVDIDACEFTGGSRLEDAPPRSGGSGLWLAGDTTGKVANSLFHTNVLNGLQMTDNAQPRIEQNRLYDNTRVGIRYGDSAGGSAVNNESYSNGNNGIAVGANAQPILKQNRLYDNTESGIRYGDSAGGSAVNNESYSNGLSGISIGDYAEPIVTSNETYLNQYQGIRVGENAQPILEKNRLRDNVKSGVAYFDSTGGSAVENESYSNGSDGIHISDSAKPTITSNEAYLNQYDGIKINGNAQPTIEQNKLYNNMASGIAYFDSAGGRAISNKSYANGLHGIAITHAAKPTIMRNEAYLNEYQGIHVHKNAQPIIEQNRLHDNTQAGILYSASASGSALNNESYNNNRWGIYVYETANPTLSNNTAYNNPDGDIVDKR